MSIPFKSIDSHSELRELLQIREHSVMLGEEDEAHKDYFLATVSCCAIGICSQGLGLKPSGKSDARNSEAWIGYNSKVANIDTHTCHVRFVVELDWVFYEILSQLADGSIIVIHELGACRVSRSGEVAWKYTTDVVIDFADDGTVLRLQTDAGEVVIDKEHGTVL